MAKKWMQKAIKHPGATKRFLVKKYGKKKALTKTGQVSQRAVDKAIRDIKKNKKGKKYTKQQRKELRRLYLARNIERMRKG